MSKENITMFKKNRDGAIKTNEYGLYEVDWNAEHIDEHRRGISDVAWENKQPDTPPKYMEGDIIEFIVGGIGIINKVSISNIGRPASYSTNPIKDKPFHAKGKGAWHYELDIKRLIVESSLRKTGEY